MDWEHTCFLQWLYWLLRIVFNLPWRKLIIGRWVWVAMLISNK